MALEHNVENCNVVKSIFSLSSINTVLFSNEPNVHPTNNVIIQNKNYKEELDNLNDNTSIWNLLQK